MSIARSFMARFADLSERRIARGRSAAADRGALKDIARELHSMAGEAGLLGVPEVMALARAAEQAALELARSGSGECHEALCCALTDLETAVRNATRDAVE